MKIKCPKCGSDIVVAEVETTVCFKINKRGDVKIVSEWQDVIEQIQNKLGCGFNCECQNCGFGFAEFIQNKGLNRK